VKRFSDTSAEFVPACERVFGARPRLLDGARAVLVDDVKLALEAGERELWVIRTHGPLEHRVGMVEVKGDSERALSQAKELLRD